MCVFVCICIYIMCVFCVHMYSYIPVSRTQSTVLRRTPSADAVRTLSFSKHILKFPLSLFLFQKIAYIDYYVLQVR